MVILPGIRVIVRRFLCTERRILRHSSKKFYVHVLAQCAVYNTNLIIYYSKVAMDLLMNIMCYMRAMIWMMVEPTGETALKNVKYYVRERLVVLAGNGAHLVVTPVGWRVNLKVLIPHLQLWVWSLEKEIPAKLSQVKLLLLLIGCRLLEDIVHVKSNFALAEEKN